MINPFLSASYSELKYCMQCVSPLFSLCLLLMSHSCLLLSPLVSSCPVHVSSCLPFMFFIPVLLEACLCSPLNSPTRRISFCSSFLCCVIFILTLNNFIYTTNTIDHVCTFQIGSHPGEQPLLYHSGFVKHKKLICYL